MNILWLTSWFPHRTDSHLGNFVHRQAEATSSFCKIMVLFAVQGEKKYEIAVEKSNFTSVTVYFPRTKNPVLKYWRYGKAWSKGYAFIKNQEQFKPDLVHLNIVYPAGLWALWLHFHHKIPFILSEHWSGFSPKNAIFERVTRKILIKYCFQHTKKALVLSQSLNRWYLKKKDIAVPNVVNTDLFVPPLSKKQDFPPFKLLHVSSLVDKQKNINGLLRSIELLKQLRTDFTFDIIGDGAQHIHFEDFIKKINLEKTIVHLHPALPHGGIAEKMQTADAFLLFSFYENQPCVILEALATGLPVICSETGCMSDWITPETGKIVAIGDEKAFAYAVNEILNNLGNYNALKIREAVVQKCSYEAVGKAIVGVYQNILQRS